MDAAGNFGVQNDIDECDDNCDNDDDDDDDDGVDGDDDVDGSGEEADEKGGGVISCKVEMCSCSLLVVPPA